MEVSTWMVAQLICQLCHQGTWYDLSSLSHPQFAQRKQLQDKLKPLLSIKILYRYFKNLSTEKIPFGPVHFVSASLYCLDIWRWYPSQLEPTFTQWAGGDSMGENRYAYIVVGSDPRASVWKSSGNLYTNFVCERGETSNSGMVLRNVSSPCCALELVDIVCHISDVFCQKSLETWCCPLKIAISVLVPRSFDHIACLLSNRAIDDSFTSK